MRYVRTKDGRIVDIKKFIEQEKKNPNYTNFKFDEIKNKEDYCYIHWTAVGTEQNSLEDQRGRTVDLQVTCDSPFIAQSNDIEELCDEFVIKGTDLDTNKYVYTTIKFCPNKEQLLIHPKHKIEIYGAIWTDKGLIYVAKMNKNGELELL